MCSYTLVLGIKLRNRLSFKQQRLCIDTCRVFGTETVRVFIIVGRRFQIYENTNVLIVLQHHGEMVPMVCIL